MFVKIFLYVTTLDRIFYYFKMFLAVTKGKLEGYTSEFVHISISILCLCLLLAPQWINDSSHLPITDSLKTRSFAVQSSAFLALSTAVIVDQLLDLCLWLDNGNSPYWLGRFMIALGFIYLGIANIILEDIPYYFGVQNNLPCIFFASLSVMKILSTSGFMIVLNKLDSQLFTLQRTMVINITTSILAVLRPYSLGRMNSLMLYLLIFQQIYHIALLLQLCYWFYSLLKKILSTSHDEAYLTEIAPKLFYLFVFTILSASPVATYFFYYYFHKTVFVNMATFTSTHVTSFFFLVNLSAFFLTLVPGRIHRLESIVNMKRIIETKTAFARFISHELRTPLSIISIGIELSLRQIPTSISNVVEMDRRQTLIEISSACRAALSILNELLLFDKITSGVMTLHTAEMKVSDYLNDALKMFQVQVREKGIDFIVTNAIETENNSKYTYIFDDDKILVDKNQMTQVLRNFVSNAIKFTPNGGKIHIDLKFKPHVSNINHRANSPIYSTLNPVSGSLVIRVKDTGAGMSTENQKKLFNGVVQFKPEVLQNGGGSGLGMMISKRILDMHRGTVEVMSPGEGLGTTFTLQIPMERSVGYSSQQKSPVTFQVFESWYTKPLSILDPNVIGSQTSSKFSSRSGTDGDCSPAFVPLNSPQVGIESESLRLHTSSADYFYKFTRLLIVDDSALSRKMLCRLLVHSGYECIEAQDGIEAIEIVKASLKSRMNSGDKIDAILMDYNMPRFDGPECTAAIRKLGYRGPIIGATGNTHQLYINHFMDQGANKVLLKPIQSEALFETLKGLNVISVSVQTCD